MLLRTRDSVFGCKSASSVVPYQLMIKISMAKKIYRGIFFICVSYPKKIIIQPHSKFNFPTRKFEFSMHTHNTNKNQGSNFNNSAGTSLILAYVGFLAQPKFFAESLFWLYPISPLQLAVVIPSRSRPSLKSTIQHL
jgi:hypothetical protein